MGILTRATARTCCLLMAMVQMTSVPVNAKSLAEDYRLSPGDEIMAIDFSTGELNNPYRSPQIPILPDGTATIHLAGTVKLAGLTVRQANEVVNELARKFVVRPDVQIVVCKLRPTNVYVLGDVVKPGIYPVSMKSNMTLAMALQTAGGIRPSGDVHNVVVTRAESGKQETVDVWQMLAKGDVSKDVMLNHGDSVFVPKGGTKFVSTDLGKAACQDRKVRIWGAVTTPGIYQLDSDDDLLTLISKAGGFCRHATTSYITLSRTERDGSISTKSIPLMHGQTLDRSDAVVRAAVCPGDLIIVHRSFVKTIASLFTHP